MPMLSAALGPARVGAPLGVFQYGLAVAGGDVEPVPAAVDERVQRQLELDGRRRSSSRPRSVSPAGRSPCRSSGRRRGASPAARIRSRTLSTHAPAAPVARRERVEVGAERRRRPPADDRGARRRPVDPRTSRPVPPRLLRRPSPPAPAAALDVQLQHVEVAVGGQDDRAAGLSCGLQNWRAVPVRAGEDAAAAGCRTWSAPTRWPCACRGTGRCPGGRRTARPVSAGPARGTVSSLARSSAVLIG